MAADAAVGQLYGRSQGTASGFRVVWRCDGANDISSTEAGDSYRPAPWRYLGYLEDRSRELLAGQLNWLGAFILALGSYNPRGPAILSRSSSPARTSRGLDPSGGPSIPAACNWSMIRAAR